MSMTAKLRRAPTRLVTGAFILNSGVGKLRGNEETAKALHGMASNAYPAFEKVDHKMFTRALGAGEVALGAALLLPVVPGVVAGAGLLAFSGGLLGMYWRTPHLHMDNDPRPTQDGIAVAKDVWMAGIAANLIVDGLTAPVHDKRVEVAHQLHDKRVEAGHQLQEKKTEAGHRVRLGRAEAGRKLESAKSGAERGMGLARRTAARVTHR